MPHADPVEDAARHLSAEEAAAQRAAKRHEQMVSNFIAAARTDPNEVLPTPKWRSIRRMPVHEIVSDDASSPAGYGRMARLIKLLGKLATGPTGMLEHLEAKALLAEYSTRAYADVHCEAE